jgi:hypothetical protein
MPITEGVTPSTQGASEGAVPKQAATRSVSFTLDDDDSPTLAPQTLRTLQGDHWRQLSAIQEEDSPSGDESEGEEALLSTGERQIHAALAATVDKLELAKVELASQGQRL